MLADILALSREAVLYTLPLYEMARMQSASSPRRDAAGRAADPSPAAGPESTWRWTNMFSHTRRLLGPADRRVVTPNNDTLYTNAWLDLSAGPLEIHAPDTAGRYYVLGFLDFWTNPFAYSGTRTTGTAAQTLFVHGPQWNGPAPAGMIGIACPTNTVWVLGRILASPDEDMAPVHALQDAFRITHPGGVPCEGMAVDTAIGPRDMPGDAAGYLRVVNRALAAHPPPAGEAQMLARIRPLGFGTDADGHARLDYLAPAIRQVLAELDSPRPSALGGGWTLPVDIKTGFGTDWHLRALVARSYIGALGIEEAMYVMADVDGSGAPLDGRRAYRLRFAPDAMPQVGAFWSLTMYRKSDYLLVENAFQRFSIGDRTPGLERDADGGLTLLLGAAAPERANNWLPAPEDVFYVALRLYLPAAAHLERRFAYPPIERIG